MRIFIAINLDEKVISYLRHMAGDLSDHFEKARMTRPENYHITLKFIGETDRRTLEGIIGAVRKTAGKCAGFSLETDGEGSFQRRNRHIFFCSVKKSTELRGLYDDLCRNLEEIGVRGADGRFRPHITLAREVLLSSGYVRQSLEPIKIEVKSICVMESTRVNGKLTYLPRHTAVLGGNR